MSYEPPLKIGQECDLGYPDGRTLRGRITLWRQVDEFIFAVSIDAGRGKIVPILLVRDAVEGVLRAEIPVEPTDEIAVRQLLGLPIRMPVNEQANVLARRVLSGGRS